MTYIGTLIDQLIRPKTGNTTVIADADTGETLEGISDTLILSYLNDALLFLQSRIISVYPSEFVVENVQNTVVGQEEYSITDNVFINNKWITVDFSEDGNSENYYPLPPAGLQQRDTKRGRVRQYIRRNGKALLNKIPDRSDSKLRINFYRAIDRLDIRRGKLTAATSTSITLANDDDLDNASLSQAQYVCVVSSLGVVKDYNIPITGYNSTTRVLSFASRTMVGTANDYVVIGKYTTTHLIADFNDNSDVSDNLIQQMLKYIKLVAQFRIFNQDSSTDDAAENKAVIECFTDIIDSFSELTEDVMSVPNIDDTTYYE